MAKTQRDLISKALKARGYTQLPNSGKAWVFDYDEDSKLYLGANGSVRRGPNKTTSVPIAASSKARLLTEGSN